MLHRDLRKRLAGLAVAALVGMAAAPGTAASGASASTLDPSRAEALARLALAGIDREFPNKPGEVLTGPDDLRTPKAMHPAFYGCFDWHSSVHGHWMLARLLRLQPDLPAAPEIRGRLGEHLSEAALAVESAYFEARENRSFERMYGWAWALRLAAELRSWEDPQAQAWARAMAPLERRLVTLTKEYLPRLTHPVRTGVHPDTAFALGQILDYARVAGDAGLEELVLSRARDYYGGDRRYPVDYEPSGEDFFSAGLNVADLMRRVLPREEFRRWLDAYVPGLRRGRLGAWGRPAVVSDLTDGKLVHLVGLNLSRAWAMQGVISALEPGDRRRTALESAMQSHLAEGLKYVFSGHYEGEHWLGTFAVYQLTAAGLGNPAATQGATPSRSRGGAPSH